MYSTHFLSILFFFLSSFLFFSIANEPVGFSIDTVQSYELLNKSRYGATLYSIHLNNQSYSLGAPLLINLYGSRYEMGYDYGVLLGQASNESYYSFLTSLIGNEWYTQIVIDALALLLDWQWNDFLSLQTPPEYLEELQGLKAGGLVVGIRDLDQIISRVITFANFPGNLSDFVYVLKDEWEKHHKMGIAALIGEQKWKIVEQFLEKKRLTPQSTLHCSMFGIWGNRTADSQLFTARNLDWIIDTGISKYKLVTVYHPDGKRAHATVGYAGVWGALTGMSSASLSVHEANLETSQATFFGFAWLLRLRYIMENAASIDEGKAIWEATNNTIGFNHMIGSAKDANSGNPGALVIETKADYSAYFFDNDPRENGAMWINETSGELQRIGYTMVDAVYRTNHGYDPEIRATFLGSQDNSVHRYMYIYNSFTYYEEQGVKVDYYEAINTTSIVGDKGTDAYSCANTEPKSGTNILSVTYKPGDLVMWAAWEDGTGDAWTPAVCNTYVKIDLTSFFEN